jgi:4-hydroxy-tetrahydrodipicolinate reductase
MMMRILIHGCGGQMGHVLADVINDSPDAEIAAGIDVTVEQEAFSFPVYTAFADCDDAADVIIDFSSPESLEGLLEGAKQKNTPLILATTGHTDDDKTLVRNRAEQLPIFQAANMSVGINLMYELIRTAATVLGDGFDIEIVEKHHNRKKDAPSGTAYALAHAVNRAFANSKRYVFGRHTRDERRKPEDIGIHAVRGGTLVGEHQVLFAGKDEVLEINHSAHSRRIYAVGALQAARFMVGKPPGYYTMTDLIAEQRTV